jgi:CheY-like chemotaxis protein
MSNEGGHFDFVVLDLHPGDMDGIDVARAINADSRFSDSHIIALTLLDDSENVSTLKDAGIAAQIFKPVKRGALRMAVEKLLISEASRDVSEGLTELQEVKSVPQGGPRLRILVGEDSPVNQKVVSHQLQALGHLVDIFGDGEAVLAAAERTPYEVILMDCQMPGIDGYEATRQIRKIEAGSQRRAWVVAMTANAMKGDRDRCIEAGMDDYISKPVRSEDLAAALRRYSDMRENSESGTAWKGVLDSEALDGFRELEAESGQSVLAGLVGIFLENSPSVIDAARSAIASENLSLLAREAHMLKGSCSNFGATRMRLACERLETAARNGELGTVASLLADVEREYEYVRVALEHEMGGVGA